MGVYTRFKKDPDGFRRLVELLESTPTSRQQKMIEIGMKEDAAYTQTVLQYVFHFIDIVNLPDSELAEILAVANPRLTAYAIYSTPQPTKNRFLTLSPPRLAAEIKEYLETPKVTSVQIGGAQIKLIEVARKLEHSGKIATKRIPNAV